MSAPMTREVALRIGLTARALQDVEAATLARALSEKLGLPVTEQKLSAVTVADLRTLLPGDVTSDSTQLQERCKEAVRFLWGEGIDASESTPTTPVKPYADGDMPGSIRVAVASNTEQNLDGHFGSCVHFLIYQVSPQETRLIAMRPTAATDEAEDRNVARSELISDCQVVYVQSIGGPAAAKVVRAGVHPVKVPKAGDAAETLIQLQTILTAPPPWLAKIMGVAPASLSRFADALEEEDAS